MKWLGKRMLKIPAELPPLSYAGLSTKVCFPLGDDKLKLLRCSIANCKKILSRKEIEESIMHVDVPLIPEGRMVAMIYMCRKHLDQFYDLF